MLGIGSRKQLASAPDIPTVAESALPGYAASTWFGLFAPAGTAAGIIGQLNSELMRILSDSAFNEQFLMPQMFESIASSPQEFSDFIAAEKSKWSNVIGEQKISIDK